MTRIFSLASAKAYSGCRAQGDQQLPTIPGNCISRGFTVQKSRRGDQSLGVKRGAALVLQPYPFHICIFLTGARGTTADLTTVISTQEICLSSASPFYILPKVHLCQEGTVAVLESTLSPGSPPFSFLNYALRGQKGREACCSQVQVQVL